MIVTIFTLINGEKQHLITLIFRQSGMTQTFWNPGPTWPCHCLTPQGLSTSCLGAFIWLWCHLYITAYSGTMMMVASMMANGGNDDDEVDLRVRRLQDQRVSGALSKTMLQRRRKRNLVKFLKIGDDGESPLVMFFYFF